MHNVQIDIGILRHTCRVLSGKGDYTVVKLDERNQKATLRLSAKQRIALTNARIRWNFVE